MAVIEVSNLTKSFKIYKKQPGIVGSLQSFFQRQYYEKKAVNNVSFEIEEGELVGFIGPNGAGKTTTLKCLSGLICPSAGKVSVLGYDPFARNYDFLRKISLVMGQKNQLWWDLPPMESFLLNKEIYQVKDIDFKKNIEELAELMDIKEILNVQVRKLSLGQRMKCELVGQLIHTPKVLFLDEPTIGLDVVMQQRLRNFIKKYNQRYQATIILTSHYMEDVEELCKRVIIIDHGKKLYDGKLAEISQKFSQHKIIKIIFNKEVAKKELDKLGIVKYYDYPEVTLYVKREDVNQITSKILADFPVADINIQEPDIQRIIRNIFTKGINN